jgi:uncharacterized protein
VILDIYTHLFPPKYLDRLSRSGTGLGGLAARMKGTPQVVDVDARFREMDKFDDYAQVLALPHPVIEEVAPAHQAEDLARLANDEMAEIVTKHPDRFPAWVATVVLTDVDAAIKEADRAIRDLGARGVQIYTNVVGRPLDLPEFRPFFAAMADHDLPIWLHPARTAGYLPDYTSETKSRYEMWWCFGWPYETAVALSRLIFSGLLDRHPGLKIITHHLGGMIPFFDGRIGSGMEVLGSRTSDEDYANVLLSLKRPHLEYFRDLYADTAMFGGTAGISAGLSFYGADHVVFASDAPFGPIDACLDALKSADMDAAAQQKVLYANAAKLLKLR